VSDDPPTSPTVGAGRVARTGRRPGQGATREVIIIAARSLFSDRGYDGTTMRLVAATAQVDPALIYHYFGSKQQLFVASMEIPFDWAAAFPALLGGPREEIGERLVRVMLGFWEDPLIRPRFMGVVRSAATDPEAAAMVRRLLAEGPVLAMARAIGTPDGELRAMLAASHIMGVALLRYILRIEPLASADVETLARLIGPSVGAYLVTGSDPG
jgi:AcrR family transcriptional regulator